MIPQEKVLLALETRYDYLSARTLLGEALRKAGLAAKTGFEAGELKDLAAALASLGQARAEGVIAALNGLAEAAPARAKAAPEPVEAPVEEAPAEEAPADAAEEEKPKAKKGKK